MGKNILAWERERKTERARERERERKGGGEVHGGAVVDGLSWSATDRQQRFLETLFQRTRVTKRGKSVTDWLAGSTRRFPDSDEPEIKKKFDL